jgi:biotin carboxyl carrier protein
MKFDVEFEGRVCKLELERLKVDGVEKDDLWRCTLDGEPILFEAHLLSPGVLSLIVAGAAYRIVLEEDALGSAVHIANQRLPYTIEDPRSLKSRRSHGAGADGPKTLKASMPGRVVRVLAQKGDEVAAHQSIVVIEAMKMQNELKSPKAGLVVEMRVNAGDTVASGDVLAIIE